MVKRDKLGRFTKECIGKENIFYEKYHTKKVKENQRNFMKQKWKNPEYRKNQIEKRKSQHYSPETEFKKGIIPWSKKGLKGIRVSQKTEFKKGHKPWNKNLTKEDPRIAKLGKKTSKTLLERGSLRGEKHPMYGKHHTKKAKKIIGLKGEKNWQNKEYRENMTIKHKKLWENSEYKEKQIKAVLNGLLKRPTSFEQKICDLCLKYNLPFIYSGNGKFLVGYKNPDFKHKYLPILIEVYNDYHHPKDYEEIRGEHFSKYGYETIFINQQEIMDKNWETICLNKLKDFL